MVFQSYALYPHLSVAENMSFGLKLAGAKKEVMNQRVNQVAEVLQLAHLLERKPKALSGGQRQRRGDRPHAGGGTARVPA
ncbi:maltose/maltodextrin transporter ATP-binding protein [Citrobacter koseri]|uniref:Maltose/maltodextrin transporter ATP-binding protein n=1 Tax=Citrobacter koseri TaxID=545 RepID=A0A2X2YDH9_CITKO|nr:maltose/maltodextrin transporter ATP-binding protein [Citrobacter koseri]